MTNNNLVDTQTLNAANGIDLKAIAIRIIDVYSTVIRYLESESFEDYVMCYPDKFTDALEGINNYVNSCVTSEIQYLNLSQRESDFIQCTANTMISAYVLENYLVEMVERLRDDALEDEYEIENEEVEFNRNRLTETE